MHIFLSGSSSILGTAVMESFFNSGHSIHSYSPLAAQNEDIEKKLQVEIGRQHFDMVLFLTGEELFNTACTKKKIIDRCARQIEANQVICNHFLKKDNQPKVILSVSSIHYYDNDANNPASEASLNGYDFLAEYFSKLEATTNSSSSFGTRVINLRLGKVISKISEPVFSRLPFLSNYIPSFLDDTSRLVSWVSQEDAIRAIHFILENEEISGPVNVTSGDTVSRREFNKSISKEFKIPKIPPLPHSLLKLVLGQDLTCLFENSNRAIPLKLMEAGFLFNNISLQDYFQESL